MITQMVLLALFGAYMLCMGILVGGFVIQYEEKISRMNWVEKLVLILLFIFWPIMLLIGTVFWRDNNE